MKKVFTIELVRNDAIYLKLWVAPEIEDLFRNDQIRTSSNWSNNGPLRYYEKPDSGELREFLRNYYDNYGSTFFNIINDKVNVGILRTVGCSDKKGIKLKIKEKYTEESLESAVKQLKKFVADLYKKFCKPINFTCTLTKKEVI